MIKRSRGDDKWLLDENSKDLNFIMVIQEIRFENIPPPMNYGGRTEYGDTNCEVSTELESGLIDHVQISHHVFWLL